jgi:outer membrane protein OmpA-like peptidoglycan-associated protein
MIPRFFRCGDPSKKCTLAVSREIVNDQPGFVCPCNNEVCSSYREEVGWVEAVTNGRSKLVYAGIAILSFVLLFALFLSGGDPAEKALAELSARFAPLESELQQLESKSKGTGSLESLTTDPKPLQANAIALEKQATDAVGSKDPMQVAGVQKRITTQMSTVRGVIESLDRPTEGSGVIAADAKSLVTKLIRLEDDAELQFEPVITSSPQSAEVCEDFLIKVSDCQERARRLASPAAPSEPGPESKATRQILNQVLSRLETTQEKIDKFAPPPPLPFRPEEADLVIAASGNLAGDLVTPLVAAWSGSEVIPAEDENFYLTSKNAKRILVKPVTGSTGFKMLAEGQCAVFFSDSSPLATDFAHFGGDLRESRSVAEVVALDALTLLVHPDNQTSSFTVGSDIPLRIAAGPKNSAIRGKAAQFGFPLTGAGEASGEDAALVDRNLMSLGFYHEQGANLRAKCLAVQATNETLPLKPSPFTIATEDYLYSFRIVAWTAPKAVDEALQLVKFTTSSEGQEVVAKQGFVDLRLTGSRGDVPPEIIAALGAAIGSDTIRSAVRLSTNFRFEVGKSSLDLKAQADLERLPRFVFDKYPNHKVVVLGFTDSDGGDDINMPLSKERAEAVSAELRRSKMDAHSAGLGPIFPVDTNDTETGKEKNRRAEIWVVDS